MTFRVVSQEENVALLRSKQIGRVAIVKLLFYAFVRNAQKI